ncbi:hypothetical protein PAG70_25925, partial [Klebsiella quasipneumoniae]|nr:hypothetical protein [Klebsiella quasipneumoniae]
KIGPDPRNFNQRVSLGRNDLLIRTFPSKNDNPNMMTVLVEFVVERSPINVLLNVSNPIDACTAE